jgi:hypothetical protein
MTTYRFLWALALGGSVLLAAGSVAAQGSELNLVVTSTCEGKDAQFEVVNKGERWPGLANVSLLRADDHSLISERKMRMVPGQRLVFRARQAQDAIGVGLWINPEWYNREFVFDSVIYCE